MPVAVMKSAGGSGKIGRGAYDEAFPRVADALTLYIWRRMAFAPVRWALSARIPAAVAIAAEALLALLVFACFWHGRYWLGLLLSVAVMLVSVSALMLARLAHATPATNRLVPLSSFSIPCCGGGRGSMASRPTAARSSRSTRRWCCGSSSAAPLQSKSSKRSRCTAPTAWNSTPGGRSIAGSAGQRQSQQQSRHPGLGPAVPPAGQRVRAGRLVNPDQPYLSIRCGWHS